MRALISRQWRGLAKPAEADRYVAHLRDDTFPQLRALAGFVDASILRRDDVDGGIEFLIVTRWTSIDAIRAFAGSDAERAVVPDSVQAMMIDYDRVVRHYVIVD